MEKNYNQSSSKKVHYRALSYFILGTQPSAYTDKTLSTENSMQISQKFNSITTVIQIL